MYSNVSQNKPQTQHHLNFFINFIICPQTLPKYSLLSTKSSLILIGQFCVLYFQRTPTFKRSPFIPAQPFPRVQEPLFHLITKPTSFKTNKSQIFHIYLQRKHVHFHESTIPLSPPQVSSILIHKSIYSIQFDINPIDQLVFKNGSHGMNKFFLLRKPPCRM